MSNPIIRWRVVLTKEDNPWLPDDVTTRNGLCIKMSPGHSISELDVEQMFEAELRSAAKTLVHLLRREGLWE